VNGMDYWLMVFLAVKQKHHRLIVHSQGSIPRLQGVMFGFIRMSRRDF
jgi:hypothetical protein